MKIMNDCNFDPNAVFEDGNTPLHYCAYYNNLKLCILLRKLKVQQIKNHLNWKPIHIAAYLGNAKIVNILCKK